MTRPMIFAALACSAFAVSALPAIAGPAAKTDVKTVEISISNYDLDKPEEAEVVFDKIKSAAKRACRRSFTVQTPREFGEEQDCRAQAIERAVAQLNEPVLTLVMNAQNASS